MIKVLNKKKEEKKIYNTICDECQTELEFEESDTYIGGYGGRELICPECGQKIYIDELEGIDLDENNIEFPVHFIHTSDRAININDDEIQKWVRECLNGAKDAPDGGFSIIASGDTVVIALKFTDVYDIYVAKKYYECSIPR